MIRRHDGLRRIESQFVTKRTKHCPKQRLAETRFVRLRSSAEQALESLKERAAVKAWEQLRKATLSRPTLAALETVLTASLAAPVECRDPVPALTDFPADITPWLCDSAALVQLLTQLHPLRHRSPGRSSFPEPNDPASFCNPWFRKHSNQSILLGKPDLCGLAWERIVPYCYGIPTNKLREIQNAYMEWRGPSGQADAIVAHSGGRDTENWLRFFAMLPTDARLREIERWTRSLPEPPGCPERLVYLAKPAWELDNKNARGLRYVWEGIKLGAPASQLIDGVIAWKSFDWKHAPRITQETTISLHLLQRLVSSIASPARRSHLASSAWTCLHERPNLEPAFYSLSESRFDHDTRCWMFRLLREAQYEPIDPERDRHFVKHYHAIEVGLNAVPPDYRAKAVHFFENVFWSRSSPRPANELIQQVSTLCRPPLSKDRHAEWTWASLVGDWKLDDLPTSCWRRIDEAWRSVNHHRTISEGFDRLKKEPLRSLIQASMRHRVRLTMELVRLSGQVTRSVLDRAIEVIATHPLIDIEVKTLEGIKTLSLLLGPRKELDRWARHQDGSRVLRAEAGTQLQTQVEGFRCEHLLRVFRDELIRHEPNNSTLEAHTRLYAASARPNRRAYHKLIRRYTSHGETGILSHPENRSWLRRQRYLKAGIWLGPLQSIVRLSDGTELRLELERRFEQVLKMGTLVNSCLALDGCNSHSALANAADINKQVVMAYDSKGRFLARQLVGVAEERKLVCFDVYGQSTETLEPAFAAFDLHLASLLSIPVHEEGDYCLKPIVCREWYDDYAWDPPKSPAATILKSTLQPESRNKHTTIGLTN